MVQLDNGLGGMDALLFRRSFSVGEQERGRTKKGNNDNSAYTSFDKSSSGKMALTHKEHKKEKRREQAIKVNR